MTTEDSATSAKLASWTPRIARIARAATESSDGERRRENILAVVSRELRGEICRDELACMYVSDWSTRSLRRDVGGGVDDLPVELPMDGEHAFARAASTRRAVVDGTRVGIPLMRGGQLVGVLALILVRADAISAGDLEPLQAIGDVVALAMASPSIGARERAAQMNQRISALREIVEALEVVPASQLHVALMRGFHLWPSTKQKSVPDFFRTALQTILEEARDAVGAQFGALGIGRSADLPFDPWVYTGVSKDIVAAMGRNPRPVGTLGVVALQGETLRLRDVRDHPSFRGIPPHHPEITSMLAVPILYGKVNVGNIYLANKRAAPEFTEEDQRIVETISMYAGQALQTSFLLTAIEAQRAQLQSTLDCAPTAIMFIDAAKLHVMANPRAMALLGRTIVPDAGVEQYVDCLAYPDGTPLTVDEAGCQPALRGEVVRNAELVISLPDKRSIPILAHAAPVRTVDNKILGAVVVFEEISAMKELARARDELAAVVAHDLRAPIQVIELQVAALLRDVEGNQVRAPLATVHRIQRCAAQLTQMTNDLLDASRTELKRFSLECKSVAPDELVQEIVAQLRPTFERHPLELSAERDVPRVLLDPLRFEQILTNLLDNAAKHSAADSPISIHLAPAPGGVLVTVEDHGAGIPADELPLLFDRYYQAHRSRAKRSGLGLGLYIAKGLVEAHDGRISVESRVGEGTTFYLWFPAEPTLHAGAGEAAPQPG